MSVGLSVVVWDPHDRWAMWDPHVMSMGGAGRTHMTCGLARVRWGGQWIHMLVGYDPNDRWGQWDPHVRSVGVRLRAWKTKFSSYTNHPRSIYRDQLTSLVLELSHQVVTEEHDKDFELADPRS
jgi:hypothetical protein